MQITSIDWLLEDKVAEIVLSGSLAATDLDPPSKLEERFTEVLKHSKYLLLLCDEVEHVCSRGWNFLLRIRDDVYKKEGELFIVAMSEPAQQSCLLLFPPKTFRFCSNRKQALQIIDAKEDWFLQRAKVFHISNCDRIVKRYTLDKEPGQVYSIGRSRESNIWSSAEQVSKNHATLTFSDKKFHLQVADKTQDSREVASTYYNFQPLPNNDPIVLHEYDYIGLGENSQETLLIRDWQKTYAVDVAKIDGMEKLEELSFADITRSYQKYLDFFQQTNFAESDQRSKLQALLKLFYCIAPKSFQPITVERKEIYQLITCYLSQILKNPDVVLLAEYNQGLNIWNCRNKKQQPVVISESALQEALKNGKGILAATDQCTCMIAPLTHPLSEEVELDSTTGFVYIEHDRAVYEAVKELFVTLMANMKNVAVAVQNASIYEDKKRKAVLQKEMENAKIKQTSLYPKKIREIPYFMTNCCLLQSMEIGGDYFDIIRGANNCYFIAIGDAEGYGISAALIVSTARAYLRMLIKQNLALNTVFSELDKLLKMDFGASMSMSMLLMRWDANNKIMEWVKAGHSPPLVYNPISSDVESLPSIDGYALGLQATEEYEIATIQLEPDSVMLLYTDGIIGARDQEGTILGREGLQKQLALYADNSPDEILHGMLGSIRRYIEEGKRDDITLVVLKYQNSQAAQNKQPILIPFQASRSSI